MNMDFCDFHKGFYSWSKLWAIYFYFHPKAKLFDSSWLHQQVQRQLSFWVFSILPNNLILNKTKWILHVSLVMNGSEHLSLFTFYSLLPPHLISYSVIIPLILNVVKFPTPIGKQSHQHKPFLHTSQKKLRWHEGADVQFRAVLFNLRLQDSMFCYSIHNANNKWFHFIKIKHSYLFINTWQWQGDGSVIQPGKGILSSQKAWVQNVAVW